MKTMTARLIAFALIVSFLALPVGLSARERRGADLIVTRLDGSQVSGELIAVKPDSLFLLSAGTDLSIPLADIGEVRIVRRSHALLFAGIGGVVGATAGAMVGVYGGGGDDEAGPATLRGGVIVGALGALAGLLTNSVFSLDSRITVAGGRPEAVAEFWDRLRSYSREGRLPGARVKPGAVQSGQPSLRAKPRLRLSVAGSLVDPTEHVRLQGGTFRFPNESAPEAGPYPFFIETQAGPTDSWGLGTFGPVSLAYDWSDRWSVEIEGSLNPATWGSMYGAMMFTSSLDGRDYVGRSGESRQVSFTSLLAGLTYRLLPPSALRRHSIEVGAAVGPAFVRSTLFDVSVVRKTVLCGRVQAAYDYYFVPAVSVGVFAGYRLMKTTIPGDVLSSLIVYEESVGPSGGTIERLTEITLPDLSVDGSGPFAGLRIGFRI